MKMYNVAVTRISALVYNALYCVDAENKKEAREKAIELILKNGDGVDCAYPENRYIVTFHKGGGKK